MNVNYIEKYELVGGTAIIDKNFHILTANENMYKFLGISLNYTIVDCIHQVDFEDFIDVANSLRLNSEKTMVIRMRRVDNSFRWMLVSMTRLKRSGDSDFEYLSLKIDDIIALKNQNKRLTNNLTSFRHMLSLDDELYFKYDYTTDVFSLEIFVDKNITSLLSVSIDDAHKFFIGKGYIPEKSIEEYNKFFDNLKNGEISYTHKFIAYASSGNEVETHMELKGSTIYENMKPFQAVGTISNIDSSHSEHAMTTYQKNNIRQLLSTEELRNYCERNIQYDANCQLSLGVIQIDNLDEYTNANGQEAAQRIISVVTDTIQNTLTYRGIVGKIEDNKYGLVIKDSNDEVSVRAFFEHIRTSISWNIHSFDETFDIKFTIGLARYPDNGSSLDTVIAKVVKAFDIAVEKGGNRFIIFKEYLHGEI